MVQGRNPSGRVRPGFRLDIDPALVERFQGYLTDESRMKGSADLVAFPESEAEVAQTLGEASRLGAKVTVSAGRTGVVGGAVPLGGWGLSVEGMNQVSDFSWDQESGEFRLKVGPGLPLDKIQRAIRSAHFPFSQPPDSRTEALLEEFRGQSTRWIFAPDPTETTAQIGGMVASNASGARTFAFGSTRDHVRGLTIVLSDRTVLNLTRSACHNDNGRISIQRPDGSVIMVPQPSYRIPRTKHAAGYFTAPKLDPIDLFIGSEGTLGVITEIEIALCRIDGQEAEVIAFFPDFLSGCRYVSAIRSHRESAGFDIESIEYLCADSLALLGKSMPAHGISNRFPEDGSVAVFTGIRIKEDVAEALSTVGRFISESGGNFDESLAAYGPVDLARIKHARHAIPESINAMVAKIKEVHPKITKLGTDMSVPDEFLTEVMQMYSRYLSEANLRFFIFGHIGNNHLHVNIIPRNPAEYDRGRSIYLDFARNVVGMGGSVSAEHGIGKLKKYLLETQFSGKALDEMKRVKRAMDPSLMLGYGTLFEF